jgi:hypothetical protein
MLFGTTSINKLDNAVTLILATLFDIPAIYVFSATTILIEEILFRGVLVSSFQLSFSPGWGTFISSALWTLWSINEILAVEPITVLILISLLLFFLSLGFLLSALVKKYQSIWPGYSFRIGVMTLTPITLTSQLVESDSFFSSTSSIFIAEGLLISILTTCVSILLLKKKDIYPELGDSRNFSWLFNEFGQYLIANRGIFHQYKGVMMSRFTELVELVQTFEKDFIKFYDKGNKSAGTRVRKHMAELKRKAQDIRIEVQELKGTSDETGTAETAENA